MSRKDLVLNSVVNYYNDLTKSPFISGTSYVPVSGKVVDESDLKKLVESCLDLWFTSGRFSKELENKLIKYTTNRWCKLTTSGSSANLLAVSALFSPLLKERQLKVGDEIITAAAGFPTTVAPIIQNGAIPKFVDIDLKTHNVTVQSIKNAFSPKTKAIVLAHTLGNAFDAEEISKFAKDKGLFLIEDCCDALGAKINSAHVGTFGDLATLSFYPAHHITTGEGGAVLGNNELLEKIVESLRDWGRDCWCKPGVDNTCKKRFDWQWDSLPDGYDHKYVYSHLGYNLKMTEMQAALGSSQMDKLPLFIEKRIQNHQYLYEKFLELKLDKHFVLPSPSPKCTPSWFGFLLTRKSDCPLSRLKIVTALEGKKVGTRLLFGGNLIKQPAFKNTTFIISEPLYNTDEIMNNSFWIGVWPGLEKKQLDYVLSVFNELFN